MRAILFFSSLLIFCITAAPPSLWAQPPTLSVRGQASLEVSPDQLQISIGVTTEGKTAEDALSRNSAAMQAVQRALLEAGVEPEELSTAHFSVSPIWNHDRSPGAKHPRTLSGYRATNSLRLRSSKLERIGELISVATAAGANDIGRLSFQLADEAGHRAEVIAMATRAARRDARALAEASDSRLVRLLSIELDHASVQNRPNQMLQMARVSKEATAPPVSPADIRLDAQVQLVFEIAPGAK